MPILTKEVEIKVNSKTVEYYKSLGYEIPIKRATESSYKRYKREFVYDFSKTITVKVEDLMRQSKTEVEVLCDYCKENVIKMPYYRYNNELECVSKIACKNCIGKKRADCNLFKYGVSNPSQLDCIKEKIIMTNLKRYGCANPAQSSKVREKMKNTVKSLYGVEHYSQTEEYKEKFRSTCTERYGSSYAKQFAEKAFGTFRDKTGYDFPSQSPEVREKMAQSYIEHYGVDSPAKSPEIREKMSQTLYANSSQKTSKQQRYINTLYQGILNYPVKYYNVDIYLPNDNLIIEYDGGGHMLNVVSGRETIEEYTQKEIVRNAVIKHEGYKQITIVSSKDLLPQDPTLLQMLSEAKHYFSLYPNHSWIEFNIDTSTVRNAEHKDGIPYSFGKLRTIKDSDLPNNENKINKNLKGA